MSSVVAPVIRGETGVVGTGVIEDVNDGTGEGLGGGSVYANETFVDTCLSAGFIFSTADTRGTGFVGGC